MDWRDILAIAATVVGSIGGGGLIVFALSGWLGRVWADRLMERERARYSQELEHLRASLRSEHEQRMTQIETTLEIHKTKLLTAHQDKLATYHLATDMVASLLAELDRAERLSETQTTTALDNFNKDRMRLYGYLAMLAPQSVMDAQDALMDHLILMSSGQRDYEWPAVREHVLAFLNEIRRDLAIDSRPIEYKGHL